MAAFALPLNVDVSDFSRIVGFSLQEALIPSMIPIHAINKRQAIRTSEPARVIMQTGMRRNVFPIWAIDCTGAVRHPTNSSRPIL